jgi:ligand-binding sensor domain-containing protein
VSPATSRANARRLLSGVASRNSLAALLLVFAASGCRTAKTSGAAAPRRQREVFAVGDLTVRSLLSDGPVVWAGLTNGIVRHDTRTGESQVFDRSNSSLLSYSVLSLRKHDGRIWVGTYGGGLSLYEGGAWKQYNVGNGLADAFVYDTARAPNGDMWIATWSGANRVAKGRLDDRSAWTTYTVENTHGGLPNDWVYAIAVDRSGAVWFGTEGGIARFDGSGWRHWTRDDGLGAPYEKVIAHLESVDQDATSEHHGWKKGKGGGTAPVAYNPNYIVSMLVDSRGRVLCGTWGGGLSILDHDAFVANYTTAEGLPGNYVTSLYEAPDGAVWVGTSQGASKVVKGDFTRPFVNFGTSDGLVSDRVFSILFDERNTPWFGGVGGAVHFLSGL